MAKREKFGKFVLLEDLETSALGTEFRAAKLGATGLERIVSVLRLSPALSASTETAKGLMDQVKVAAQLQNPNVIRIYGIGKVDALYYVSYEFVEGKSLRLALDRCRREGFPFSIDHALLISSKICSALEYSHGRRTEAGSRYFHGLVNPGNVLISYEGEVRVRGFGHWFARLREAGVLRDEDVLYLSPEQAAGGPGDTRSDVFAVGAVLFEMLTGQPLFQGGRSGDIAARLASARLQSPSGEDDRIPQPIAQILARTLTQEPSVRYAEVQELRKAIDTLLFSGDFTPTTFNLAFFMHTLFRDDIDRESKVIKEEREAGYAEFLVEAPPRPGAAGVAPVTTPIPRTTPVPRVQAAPAVTPEPVPLEQEKVAAAPQPAHAEAVAHPAPASGTSAKEAAASFTFHKEAPAKRGAPMIAAIVVGVGLLAGAAYYFLGRGLLAPRAATPVPTTLSPEAVAALAKVKELEDKLKVFEEEKAAAEQKAKDEAAAKLQKEAKARGGEVDPAALQKAQDDAAKKARLEQEKKQQEEKRKLEETKAAEEARLAEEQRKADEQRRADEAARLAAAATTTTLPAATLPPTTTLPPVRPGTLVNLSDPGVVAPVVEKTAMPVYPEMAVRQRIEGSVDLNILVDEKGAVVDAQVTSSAGPGWRAQLDEAALASVRRRRYKPATKDGVPVKVWISVRVQFKPPA
jgi:eukaryotic-like serine/threonine-protein kinase